MFKNIFIHKYKYLNIFEDKKKNFNKKKKS